MLKRVLALTLSVSIACAGMAHAQSATAPNGTATTKPSTTMTMTMPGMPGMPASNASSELITAGELAAIGVGVVVGVVLFQGAVWHGMTIMGAMMGGYVGDYLYNSHTTVKTSS